MEKNTKGRNDKMLITIYLAGACLNEVDEGKTWRGRVAHMFRYLDKYNDVKVIVVNPTDYFSYSDPVPKTDKQVKNFFMNKILHSDIVLCNLERSKFSIGTAQEVQFAVDNKIPVIGFNKGKESHGWIENVDCDVAFDTEEEAFEYIVDYYINSSSNCKV